MAEIKVAAYTIVVDDFYSEYLAGLKLWKGSQGHIICEHTTLARHIYEMHHRVKLARGMCVYAKSRDLFDLRVENLVACPPQGRKRKQSRPVYMEPLSGHALITASDGLQFIVDLEAVPHVGHMNWFTHKGYACAGPADMHVKLHRVVYEALVGPIPSDMMVDHKNALPADCRLENLRLASPYQNMHNVRLSRRNTSGVKGVSWSKQKRKWIAYVNAFDVRHHVGFFDRIEEAAAAVDQARMRLHGEYARCR